MSLPAYPGAKDRAGAVLTIDLDAITANWRALSAKVSPQAQVAAVVKADAYGLGAVRVGRALFQAGCRRFVVATLDEAIPVRAMLPQAEILVLSGPLPGTAVAFAANDLWPVLNSPEQIADWAELARASSRTLPAVLHVDTGMTRLGLTLTQARTLAQDPSRLAGIDLKLILSHLACADEAAHPMNGDQLRRFAAVRALFPTVEGSLAASSGIFLGAQWQADWVRPGAALYGINPTPHRPNPMAQVVRLDAKIIQVRDVDAGESVGYGASHHCAAKTRLAIAAAGYADGLFRSLSNKGCGQVGERLVPLVGRVSMDLAIFDIGAECAVNPGDAVTLIGPGNDLDAVAKAAGTIGYEILTSLGSRYHRHYLGGAS